MLLAYTQNAHSNQNLFTILPIGNNSTTETFSFGKPMIVMPLFADQFDNGQRVAEKGLGLRMEPYSFTEAQLLAGMDRLLHDAELNRKLQAAATRIAQSNSKDKACVRMERLVEEIDNFHFTL